MNSRLYECQVMHARFVPKRHRFAYRLFLLAIDLDELPLLHRRLRLFSVNRPNFYSFRETDYLPTSSPVFNPSSESEFNPISNTSPAATGVGSLPVGTETVGCLSAGVALKARVLTFFAAHGVDLGPGGRIEMVTLPRIFGYAFNPVSFYYGYDASGACLGSIAEVTNTFHELKPYFLGPGHRVAPTAFHRRTPKFFYVSPFSDVDLDFDFHLRVPTEQLLIQIDDYVGATRTLTSTVNGPAGPLTDARLAWFTLKYPLLTLRVIGLIHWQALRLFWKRIPWFAKSARAADQRDLYHPHASLTHSTPAAVAHSNSSCTPDA